MGDLPNRTAAPDAALAACDSAIESTKQQLASLLALRAQLAAPAIVPVDQDSEEILARYGLNDRTYMERGRRGEIRTRKVGRKVCSDTAELDRWYATCARAPKPEPAKSDDPIAQAIELAAERVARRAARRAAR